MRKKPQILAIIKLLLKRKTIFWNLRKVDCFRKADGAPCGPPGKLLPILQAADGSLDVLDPELSLLYV